LAEHQAAAGAEHPPGLRGQGLGVGQALQHVVAEDPVEGGVRERQRVLQVGLEEQDPGRAGGRGRGQRAGGPVQRRRAGVHADRHAAAQLRRDLDEGGAGAAAEVDHPVAGAGVEQPGQPAVPDRHHRFDHRVDVVAFVRHDRTLPRVG
jgi:hypothetical protein